MDNTKLAEVRKYHDNKKSQQKIYHDRRTGAKPKNILAGDKVLIKQKKTTTRPPFDPNPFTVTNVDGNKVTYQRRWQQGHNGKRQL